MNWRILLAPIVFPLLLLSWMLIVLGEMRENELAENGFQKESA